MYVGDDVTDLDAFRGLTELQERGRLGYALRVGVRSDETPRAIEEQADTMVDGTDGVRDLLRALLDLSAACASATSCKATVLLSARLGDAARRADGGRHLERRSTRRP